jgi:adenosylcobinamide kinase/adenosylcobinamide-phosphate guanylyltransferase
VFVGNDVFRSGEEYEGEMQRYLEVLASAMRHVAERADLVVEVVCGVPVLRKGHLEPGSQLESVYLETGALV